MCVCMCGWVGEVEGNFGYLWYWCVGQYLETYSFIYLAFEKKRTHSYQIDYSAGCGLRAAGHIQLLPCNKVIAQENYFCFV